MQPVAQAETVLEAHKENANMDREGDSHAISFASQLDILTLTKADFTSFIGIRSSIINKRVAL
ncbi:MAG: hypothetical protein CVT75_05785 [Alphaproteobacteria bacterium HGW-Alphaproteobacteria-14]|nr:MAG: hypothetical protein CVT75_05785 [Alphaproteobacteria bacterium HGW-Alphaproteobacteria-14]